METRREQTRCGRTDRLVWSAGETSNVTPLPGDLRITPTRIRGDTSRRHNHTQGTREAFHIWAGQELEQRHRCCACAGRDRVRGVPGRRNVWRSPTPSESGRISGSDGCFFSISTEYCRPQCGRRGIVRRLDAERTEVRAEEEGGGGVWIARDAAPPRVSRAASLAVMAVFFRFPQNTAGPSVVLVGLLDG